MAQDKIVSIFTYIRPLGLNRGFDSETTYQGLPKNIYEIYFCNNIPINGIFVAVMNLFAMNCRQNIMPVSCKLNYEKV